MVSPGKTTITRSAEREPVRKRDGLREKGRTYGGEMCLEAAGQGGAEASRGDCVKGGEAGYALPRIPGAAGGTGPASPLVLRCWENREGQSGCGRRSGVCGAGAN